MVEISPKQIQDYFIHALDNNIDNLTIILNNPDVSSINRVDVIASEFGFAVVDSFIEKNKEYIQLNFIRTL